jgi:anti-sigma B factor antagonist
MDLSRENGVTVVAVSGAVDSESLREFRKNMAAACAGRRATVLLDCRGLTYLNSSAIGLIAVYRRKLLSARGSLAICNVDKATVRTLDLLEVGRLLKIYPDRETALQAIR